MADQGVARRWRPTRPLPDTSRVRSTAAVLDRLHPLLERLARSIWRVHDHGRELVPAEGPVVFAVNHVGLLDGPLAVALLPNSQAMAKKELWANAALGRVLTLLGQIPIDRWNPDPDAIRRCVALLRDGRRLVIFPEMHRGAGDFERFRHGTAYLALASGASVVPVALVGTAVGGTGLRSIPRPGESIHVVYGSPIAVRAQEWPRTAGEVAELTERLRVVCAQHVQQARQQYGPGTAQEVDHD